MAPEAGGVMGGKHRDITAETAREARATAISDTHVLIHDIGLCIGAEVACGVLIEWAKWHGMQWDAVNTVTVVLSALSVILTSMTIILAVAAVWGYSSIKQAAEERAEKAAERIASEIAQRVAKETAQTVAARTVAAMDQREINLPGDNNDYGEAAANDRR